MHLIMWIPFANIAEFILQFNPTQQDSKNNTVAPVFWHMSQLWRQFNNNSTLE